MDTDNSVVVIVGGQGLGEGVVGGERWYKLDKW